MGKLKKCKLSIWVRELLCRTKKKAAFLILQSMGTAGLQLLLKNQALLILL